MTRPILCYAHAPSHSDAHGRTGWYFGLGVTRVSHNLSSLAQEGANPTGINGVDSPKWWSGLLSWFYRHFNHRENCRCQDCQRGGRVLYSGVRRVLDTARTQDDNQEGGGIE